MKVIVYQLIKLQEQHNSTFQWVKLKAIISSKGNFKSPVNQINWKNDSKLAQIGGNG